ncbi:major facilitator superfamily domain-containing protein [Aspergillus leporis]|uniref:Major facilitator superfamily domain-containing protein n=1 Tax=Aspergillus leporis TaxID=41062 RepID=A0A5N5WW48_9EURO|nr:major facilitator superfamily domain-containing protein [Aspergillus leporis]
MASALAKSYQSLLILRLVDGMAASTPIAIVGDIYADIEAGPKARGRLMWYYMTATTIGPILGPLASGFLTKYGWRTCFRSSVSLPLVILTPESYAPIILQKRAKRLRKETGNPNIVSPSNLAYLLAFEGIYGMTPAYAGLCFLPPLGVGAVVACMMFLWYDSFLSRAKARNATWAHIEEYRRLPLACIGGPLYVIPMFLMGWTVFPNIHWSVPALSGIPFGAGYLLNFMAMANYLADSYEIYSASALSASACTRGVLGAMLPLATKPIFDRLGANWAYTLVASLSLGVTVIPFIFIHYGHRIRQGSKFCQEIRRLKEAERDELSVIHTEPKGLSKQGSHQ